MVQWWHINAVSIGMLSARTGAMIAVLNGGVYHKAECAHTRKQHVLLIKADMNLHAQSVRCNISF